MTKNRLIFALLATLCFVSCQTYTNENSTMRNEMYAGDFTKATTILDSSRVATQDRNFALFRMEKGMLLYLNEQYDQAIQLWTQADKRLDDLYTTSISRTTSSFVINDSMSDYQGEAHERILLPIFSSIAFLANNNVNNAQVMIRRTYDVTNVLQSENSGENTFKYDAFSHYFSGMIYEATKNWDNALVEYRKALENISQQTNDTDTDKSAKNEVLSSLARIAEYRRRGDILEQVKKLNSHAPWIKQEKLLKKGEIYIIYECGKSPIKRPEEIILPTNSTLVKVSFPKYENFLYQSHYANIYVNHKLIQKTVLLENIGKMAEQALADRRVRDIAKMAARVIAKDVIARKLNDENPFAGLAASILNVATEVADTRSWTTLPDSIQVARIPVEANQKTEIEIMPEVGNAKKFSVTLNAGEKKLFRLRTFN